MENNDAAGMIGKLLEDPETLSRLMTVASGIMESMGQGENPQKDGRDDGGMSDKDTFALPSPAEPNSASSTQGISDLAGILTGLLSSVKPKKDDPRCALLYALRPYMSKKRADRIETLVKVLSVSELAGGLLSGSGLFS